jgi:hypothetical protein
MKRTLTAADIADRCMAIEDSIARTLPGDCRVHVQALFPSREIDKRPCVQVLCKSLDDARIAAAALEKIAPSDVRFTEPRGRVTLREGYIVKVSGRVEH